MTSTPKTSGSRYDRQVRVRSFGREGQARLRGARVGIVGLGALGSRVAEDLARAGAGFLRLIDRDWVEVSNLHRQHLFDQKAAEEEEPKALSAARILEGINSEVETEPSLSDLGPANAEELLLDLDLWIDGTDNFQTRYLLNDLAVREGRPWIYGACVSTQAMVAPFLPGRFCLRCLFPSPPPAGSSETCETAGILPPAAAWVAALQTALALRLLGCPDAPPEARLFTADLHSLEQRSLALPVKPDEGCPCCMEKRYPALEPSAASRGSLLCGRNAVQLSAPAAGFPPLEEVAERIEESFSWKLGRYMLRIEVPEGRITVFEGGRAIVQGTEDPGRARALFDRYLGT